MQTREERQKYGVMYRLSHKEKHRIYAAEYRDTHRMRSRATSREYYRVHRKERQAYDTRYRGDHKWELANRRCLHAYGLTLEGRDALFAGGCEICGGFKRLCVDHDHESGKVRGCLCSKCNVMLGMMGDALESDRFKAIVTYLEGCL